MIGQTLSHYEILEKLGEGGMGVVYRALDVRLNRPVAIKVLPHDAMADADRARRFLQEARAASALNHPHIITVYEVDASGGTDFIVMEYVTGSTLEHLIARKALTLRHALKHAAQIADALASAHRAGIVHRDLKPGNVMITERGDVKVLDFGLAKLTEGADAAAVGATTQTAAARTEAGTILGTVAYMSPEQAEGKTVDARSDIFSFGSLLYEMVTGRRAFEGETKLSTLSAILQKDPRPASELTREAPAELDGIIAHCLRKDPGRRFQHLEDVQTLIEGLREVSATKVEVGRQGGRVGARTRRPLLVAATVLLGAAVSGATWWLARDRPREPAATPPSSRLSTGGPPSTNPEANRYFENAMQLVKVNNDVPKARLMLDRALDLDPHFAEARAWNAFTDWLALNGGFSNDSALLYKVEAELRRALRDDPHLGRAHAVFAAVHFMRGRKELVPAEVEAALKANPNDEDALHWLLSYHIFNGDNAEAHRVAQEVLARNPLFFPTRMVLGELFREQGDLTGAMREQEKILELSPQNAYVMGQFLPWLYLDSGDTPKARQALERGQKADRQSYRTRMTWAVLLAREGRRAEALKEMDDEVLKWAALVAYQTAAIAEFFAVLGDAPNALDWLDRAVRSGDERTEFFRRDPLLANIRNHPRFDQIIQSIAYRRQQRQLVK